MQRGSEVLGEQVGESVSQRGQTTRGTPEIVPPAIRDATVDKHQAPGRGDLGEPTLETRDERHMPGKQPGEAERRERYEPLMPQRRGESVANSSMAAFVEPVTPTVTGSAIREAAAMDGESGQQRRDRRSEDEEAQTEWKFEPLIAASEAKKSLVQSPRDGQAVAKETPGGQRVSGEFGEPASRERDPSAGPGQVGMHLQPASGSRSAAEIAAGRRLARLQQARAEQHGDEIQIHIGRIEVTAMPPAAPRPMPVPARKTQTLDEYLRRGTGRAG